MGQKGHIFLLPWDLQGPLGERSWNLFWAPNVVTDGGSIRNRIWGLPGERSWNLLVASGGSLGTSWGSRGEVLEPIFALLTLFRGTSGPLWAALGIPRAILGAWGGDLTSKYGALVQPLANKAPTIRNVAFKLCSRKVFLCGRVPSGIRRPGTGPGV